jgi:D-xylose transport system substrate-binding protein
MNIRNILMVASLALSILIGSVLARGGKSGGSVAATGSGDKLIIGLSLDTLKEARWQRDKDNFVAKATALGAQVEVQSANSDDNTQIQNVQSLLTAGAKVLVIAPHDGKAMARAVEMAHKAGVPVIAYDRLVLDSDLDLYVSFDNVKVGELQAQYMVDNLPNGKGKIICVYGSKTDNNAKLFKQGQDNILNPLVKKGDIQIIRADWAEDWKPENAKRIVNAAITDTGGSFDGVLASNDGTAGGAIQALSEAGMAGKVVVTGQDAELPACQRIIRGTQSMTIYKPLKKMADEAATAAVNMAKGKPVIASGAVNNGKGDIPTLYNTVYAVTKNNMKETVIKDGFYKESEVYGQAGG